MIEKLTFFDYYLKKLAISTTRLNTLLCLHLSPINLVVSQEALVDNLGVGFVLRCFQHLSLPNVATQRC